MMGHQYFDKQEPSMNPCRMLELPRHTFGLFPRLKDGWVHGRANRKVAADRLSAPVKGLIRVLHTPSNVVVSQDQHRAHDALWVHRGLYWYVAARMHALEDRYSLSIGLPTP